VSKVSSLLLAPARPRSAAERFIAAVGARRKATNRYQTDFHAFLTELCWTRDEAAGGRVAKIPDWPYLREMSEILLEHEKVFVEKSRRVLASWVVSAYDCWILGGGQSPKWPALMNATGNRHIFVVARKYESSCYFLEQRIRFIVDQFEARGGRDLWPTFPKVEWKQGYGYASNGSVIQAVGQGSDQLRGVASTLCHIEEASFMEQAKATFEGLLPTLRGGGRCVVVSTPNAASYASRLVAGTLRSY
jgi:hypothetical protein